MENFKTFEIQNAEMVFGGDLEPTTWWSNDGCDCGTDFYDTETGRYVFLGVN